MSPKHVPPSVSLQAFSCPTCDALADQGWFVVRAERTNGGGTPPLIPTPELVEDFRSATTKTEKPDSRMRTLERLELELVDKPHLYRLPYSKSADYDLLNVHLSRCRSCGQVAIWLRDRLLYPPHRHCVAPNPDLPEDIQRDFEEARSILDVSPRGAAALLRLCIQKLCAHLKVPGGSINENIKAMVAAGLDPKIQQALDIVRVIGNEAVHPGQMDLKDNRDVAAKLFDLVNLIAYDRITRPNEIDALFATLPPSAVAQIAKRDGKP